MTISPIYDYCINNKIEKIDQLNNEQISSELTKVKGIGQWTVDMFLMFTLNRVDVFPLGDLGIKKRVDENLKN